MPGQPDCSTPGRRTLHRQSAVGGPHWAIPVPLIIAGAVAQVVGMALIADAGSDLSRGVAYGPLQLGAVHMLGLAFVSVVIVAALMQLVPVLLRTRLAPDTVLLAMGWAFAVGSWALAIGLWRDHAGATAAGGALVVASGLAVVVALALALARAWRTGGAGAASAGLAVATGWLLVVLVLGALMAGNRLHPFLDVDRMRLVEAHGAAAALGWIGGVVLAVSLKLAPMFALAHEHRQGAGRLALAAWHPGVALVAIGLFLGMPIVAVPGGVLLLVGIGSATWFAVSVATHRRRRAEAPMVHLLLGLASLGAAVALAIAAWATGAAGPRTGVAVTILVLVGLGTGATSGHLFKVQPMLVWTGRFAHMAGTPGAPKLADLYPHGLAVGELVAFTAGLVALVAGVLGGSAPAVVGGAAALLVASLAVVTAVVLAATHRVPGPAGRGGGAPTSPPRRSPTAPAR